MLMLPRCDTTAKIARLSQALKHSSKVHSDAMTPIESSFLLFSGHLDNTEGFGSGIDNRAGMGMGRFEARETRNIRARSATRPSYAVLFQNLSFGSTKTSSISATMSP